jgi:hypothetical protein
MPVLDNITTINQTELINVGNVTSLTGFMSNVNNTIFDGILFFILVMTMWVILLISMEKVKPAFLENLTYTGGAITLISLMIFSLGLMSARLAFIPGLVTAISLGILWAMREK